MSARHAQLLRTLVEHTVHQLSAHSASAMAHNPRKRTWQLVFWVVASRRGDDRSSAASKREAKKQKIPLLPTLNSRILTGFRNFCGSGTMLVFNLVAPQLRLDNYVSPVASYISRLRSRQYASAVVSRHYDYDPASSYSRLYNRLTLNTSRQ